jgi:hypothetical protein
MGSGISIPPNTAAINTRIGNQNARAQALYEQGDITQDQLNQLLSADSATANEVASDRLQNGPGQDLTQAQVSQLTSELNAASQNIFQTGHPGANMPAPSQIPPNISQIDERIGNQQDRIAALQQQGAITPDQANALDQQAQQAAALLATDRLQNGAGQDLTSAQTQALNGMLNTSSQAIAQFGHPFAAPSPTPVGTTPPGTTPSPTTVQGGMLQSNTTGQPETVTMPNGQTATLPPNAIMLNDGTVVQPSSTSEGQGIMITTPNGQSATFTGDPHAQTQAGNFDVQGTANGQGFQVVEAGGSVINVNTSAPDQNGATYITSVTATGPGGRQATISNINSADGSPPQTSSVTLLQRGSSAYLAARALNPNETILTNAGSIDGQSLGANFVTMEPNGTPGTANYGEVTGGSNTTGYQFNPDQVTLENINVVNQMVALWNSLGQSQNVPSNGQGG